MSLVPIIYTSLLIFSAFMLFVIIISYISYKTKNRSHVPSYARNYDPLGKGVVVQPALANNYRIDRQVAFQYVMPNQTNSYPPKIAVKQNSEDNYSRTIQEIKQKNHDSKIRHKRNADTFNNSKRSRESYPATRTYKTGPTLNRLEIMNESEKFKTSSYESNENYSAKQNKRSASHGDINVLSFYSDRSDFDSSAFSIPKIQRAV